MSAIANLIAELFDDDSALREAAAAKLYELGMELSDSVADAWRKDTEFASLLAGPPTVGVAVWPHQFERIRLACGKPRLADVPPDQDAKEFELHLGKARLDILTSEGQPGAIAGFLEKFGEGIQQVELPVSDVGQATEILRTRFGVKPVYPQTRAGADGTRVNFFLAANADGKKVLVELVEEAGR